MRPDLRSARPSPGARRLALAAAGIVLLLLTAALAPALRAATTPTATQTFSLQPGWNAIFLEVVPADPDPAVVFAGLPVDQVWAFFQTKSPVQFLSDPAAGLFNVPGWNVWLPTGSRPDAALLSDLKAVIGHQAYLVKNTGTAAATLSVTGASSLQDIRWNPDSFTLTGLPVDPAPAKRAGDFFAGSPAHVGQPRYRLDPAGTWTALTDGSDLAPGQAYWVFTKGGSDFSSPVEVHVGGGRVLDFGPDGETARLTVRNRSLGPVTFTLTNPGSLPLSYQVLDTAATVPAKVWKSLPATLPVPLFPPAASATLAAGETATVTLGVRRAGLTADLAGTLRVAAQGVTVKVPVAAQLANSAGLGGVANRAAGRASKGSSPSVATPPSPNAGLWVGTATLNQVSEANATSFSTPTATPAEFGLRLILHVDNAGTVRLLKEVILMKGRVAAGATPPLVLVSNPARLSDFDAPTTRDGSPFANRISAIGFDFSGTELALSGGFGSTLTGNVVLGRDLATNPFKHRYHPDHDDLNAQYQAPAANLPPDQQEVWGVTRAVALSFDPPPTGNASPGAGYTERTGTYQETITGVGTTHLATDLPGVTQPNPGLHRNPITVLGTFTLRRLNAIDQLNPAVTP